MRALHPMIEAIGEDEFKKGLDALPEYYTEKDEGNFKAIGMQLIWDTKHVSIEVRKNNPSRVMQEAGEAYGLWKSGASRQEAVRKALVASAASGKSISTGCLR